MPSEIAKHLPEARSTSGRVKDSAYLSHIFERSGEPLKKGVVGIATFSRHEHVDRNLIYAAHVNYHVILGKDGSTYELERHVTNTEHGPHKAAEYQRRLGRLMTDPRAIEAFLGEMTDLINRVEATRPIEKAMGILTVTAAEAQQVIDFTHKHNS